jgi:hypothetical protein
LAPLRRRGVISSCLSNVRGAAGQPMQVLGGCSVSLTTAFENGRRIVPPGECPSTGVTARWGVSDPACSSHARPRGRSAESLTPHTFSVGDVLGRALDGG